MGADPRPNCLIIDEIDGAPQVIYLYIMYMCNATKSNTQIILDHLKNIFICLQIRDIFDN
jgi:hypothetical protein